MSDETKAREWLEIDTDLAELVAKSLVNVAGAGSSGSVFLYTIFGRKTGGEHLLKHEYNTSNGANRWWIAGKLS